MPDNDIHGRRIGVSPRATDARETEPRGATEEAPRRRRRGRRGLDPFAIPQELIPEGMTWEWKRETFAGQPDPHHQANLAQDGWEAVDATRVAALAPQGATGPFRRDGLVLMERPTELCIEAREEELHLATGRNRELEAKLGVTNPGELPRFTGTGRGGPAVSRSYENVPRGMAIPE